MTGEVIDRRRSKVISVRLTRPEMIRLQAHAIIAETSLSEMVRQHVSKLIDREGPLPSRAEDSSGDEKWFKKWFAEHQRERTA